MMLANARIASGFPPASLCGRRANMQLKLDQTRRRRYRAYAVPRGTGAPSSRGATFGPLFGLLSTTAIRKLPRRSTYGLGEGSDFPTAMAADAVPGRDRPLFRGNARERLASLLLLCSCVGLTTRYYARSKAGPGVELEENPPLPQVRTVQACKLAPALLDRAVLTQIRPLVQVMLPSIASRDSRGPA